MSNPYLKFSLYFIILYVVSNLAFYLVQPTLLFHVYIGWLWLLIMIGFMWAAIREEKINNEGSITLQQGVKQSWLTFVIGMTFTYLFNYLLTNVIDPQLLEIQKEVQIEAVQKMARSMGLSEDSIQKQVEKIEQKESDGLPKLSFGYALYLVLGAIPSFILAAFMKSTTRQSA